MPVTIAQAARWFGLSYGCVHRWAERGLVEAVGVDEDGRWLYALPELASIERSTRRQTRGRPRLDTAYL